MNLTHFFGGNLRIYWAFQRGIGIARMKYRHETRNRNKIMKIFFQRNRKLGLTLVEGLVVLAVTGFIAMIWLYNVNKRPTRGRRIAC
ncbi:MAG: prepilin-type N-terminal cleavage/methylation domain-containing protein, partial [Verrucomicrobiota bacterium]|nr:prepilin-type N-terminal cleavage/methylation domain-containing protein [Verrucomicrobiota bacterium]